MSERAAERVQHVQDAIIKIRRLLVEKTLNDLVNDDFMSAAYERFLEIISEASRHIPEEWKMEFGPDIPWRQIADLGNQLRHAYNRLLPQRLWAIYENDLDPLEIVIQAMAKAHPLSD